jgi:hypothetical protein
MAHRHYRPPASGQARPSRVRQHSAGSPWGELTRCELPLIGAPNLLNVKVSRAKEALYVVGNRRLRREAGVFRELDARMPRS